MELKQYSGDVIYLNRFVWNGQKASDNKKKHGVSFEIASEVFNDVAMLEEYDAEHSSRNEERYDIIGMTGGDLVLFVVAVEQNNLTRIISARRANNIERSLYYENAKKICAD